MSGKPQNFLINTNMVIQPKQPFMKTPKEQPTEFTGPLKDKLIDAQRKKEEYENQY